MNAGGDRPAAVLIDIEGTVGSIRFVKEVLFPFARARLREFVTTHRSSPDVAEQLAAVARETGRTDLGAQLDELERWSDADRKATPLKALQGMIWDGGYQSGALVSHLYPDAICALQRWREKRLPAFVYSSGSVPAQKLYFAHTEAGELSDAISGYFDTTTGPKHSADSYTAIARVIGAAPDTLVFLSDARAELVAATSAGLRAIQVRRDGTPNEAFEPWIDSFDRLPL